MRKRILLVLVGTALVVAGIAAFSAFTAQIVNLTAHVEKEIEFSAVTNCTTSPVTGNIVCHETSGSYGTVIPEEEYDKLVEVTLSNSFRDRQNQTRFGDVHFDLLWECKQELNGVGPLDNWNNLTKGPDGKYTDPTPDGFPDCLEDIPGGAPGAPLDDNLRNFVSLISSNAPTRCEFPAEHTFDHPAKLPSEKEVTFIKHGVLIDDGTDFSAKCLYTVKLLAPPCSDSFNPFTDPNGPNVKTIVCHFVKPSDDPQTWEHFANIGDDLKVQVTFHSQR